MKLPAIVEIEVGDDPTKCGKECFALGLGGGIHCKAFNNADIYDLNRCPACLAATEMAERFGEENKWLKVPDTINAFKVVSDPRVPADEIWFGNEAYKIVNVKMGDKDGD